MSWEGQQKGVCYNEMYTEIPQPPYTEKFLFRFGRLQVTWLESNRKTGKNNMFNK